MIKRTLLALTITLLLPNMSFAAACVDGANPDGCTISTSDTEYTLTGNISTTGGYYSHGLYIKRR